MSGQQFLDELAGANTNEYCVSIEDDVDFHIAKMKMFGVIDRQGLEDN